MKDYLSPSWLFGYFKANEPEPEESLESEEDSDNEDSDDEDSPLNVQRSSHGSSSTRKETPNRSSIDEGNTVIVAGNATNAVTPSSVLTEKERVSDMIYLHPSTFSENNNKGETCKQEGMTVRLSGVVDSEREVCIIKVIVFFSLVLKCAVLVTFCLFHIRNNS